MMRKYKIILENKTHLIIATGTIGHWGSQRASRDANNSNNNRSGFSVICASDGTQKKKLFRFTKILMTFKCKGIVGRVLQLSINKMA